MEKKQDKNKTMEIVDFLLAGEQELEVIMSQICKSFGIEADEKGNTIQVSKEEITVNITAYTKKMDETRKEFIEKQVNMVWGHFYQVETEAVDAKINLLHQIRWTNSFLSIHITSPFLNERRQQLEQSVLECLFSVLPVLSGIILTEGATRALNASGQIILDDSGNSQDEHYMPHEIGGYWEERDKKEAGTESFERRKRSREEARQHGIFVTQWLPLLPSQQETTIPGVREIAGRMTALLTVAIYSECLLGEKMSVPEAREYITEIAERFGAEEFFSPKEKEYLDCDVPTEQDQINYAWQYENVWVMEWALGLTEELPYPDQICDVPLTVRLLASMESLDAIIKAAKPRAAGELLDAADLIYCLDWACVDARIYSLPAPGKLDSGVVMERHKALNWLIQDGEKDWDNVDIST